MSDVFFNEMHIPKPDYFLGIGGQTHGTMTGQMIEKIEEILVKEKPDLVMVYGDANSILAAVKLNIKIAHVEAGLRSFNMGRQEEVNRIVTDRVSRILFCPTQVAMDNLQTEPIDQWNTDAQTMLVGDVMQDGAIFYKDLAQKPSDIYIHTNFILCTIHRAENTDDAQRLANIIDALNEVAKEKQVILLLRPRTKKILEQSNLDTRNLIIIDPVGYFNMVWLINNCKLVMTDSGGLQKEAYFFKKPCVTLRDETEWVELVASGVNVLVGANTYDILCAFEKYMKDESISFSEDFYGSGLASHAIINMQLSAQ